MIHGTKNTMPWHSDYEQRKLDYEQRKRKIFFMVLDGMSYREVGKRFDICQERVGQIFHKMLDELSSASVAPFDDDVEVATNVNQVRENRAYWELKLVNFYACCRSPATVAREFQIGKYIGG